jgi:hypothetical protein
VIELVLKAYIIYDLTSQRWLKTVATHATAGEQVYLPPSSEAALSRLGVVHAPSRVYQGASRVLMPVEPGGQTPQLLGLRHHGCRQGRTRIKAKPDQETSHSVKFSAHPWDLVSPDAVGLHLDYLVQHKFR